MLLTVFGLMILLSIIFMVLGFVIDIPLFSIIGAVFLFGMGFVMLNNQVEVKTGEVVSNNYINVSGNTSVVGSQTIQYTYEPYDFGSVGSVGYGWLLVVLSVFLAIIFIMTAGD